METWSTVDEASAMTNHTLTTGDLYAANQILELWVAVNPGDHRDVLKRRDLRLLKSAESYQAAWMQSKPALFARSDTDRVIQDTLQYDKGDKDMHVLAPLAKAAIQRLSWRSTRSLEPLTPQQAAVLRGKLTPETMGRDFDDLRMIGWTDWEEM